MCTYLQARLSQNPIAADVQKYLEGLSSESKEKWALVCYLVIISDIFCFVERQKYAFLYFLS